MIRKSLLVTAFLIILVLIFFSFFPQTITEVRPNQRLYVALPANDGENILTISTRIDEFTIPGQKIQIREGIEIDSVFVQLNDFKKKISDLIMINPENDAIVPFNISLEEFPKKSIVNLKFIFHTSSYPKRISFCLNKVNDEELIKAVKIDDYTFESPVRLNNYIRRNVRKIEKRLAVSSFLGTDSNGFDVWSRLVYGIRIILTVSIFSSLISVFLGTILGFVNAYYKNWLSKLILLIAELFSSMSLYIIAILITLFFQKNILIMIIAFSILQWVEIERIISEKVAHINNQDFIKASKMVGKSNFAIFKEDFLPLLFPQLLIGFFFLTKRIIVIEASLSFLGFSVDSPNSSIGNIISEAGSFIFSPNARNFVVPPIIAILVTSLAFNIIEMHLRDKFRENK